MTIESTTVAALNPSSDPSRAFLIRSGTTFPSVGEREDSFAGPETMVCEHDVFYRERNSLTDLNAWSGLDPARHAVISALALTVEKRNRGKQKEVRAILHLANEQVYFLLVTHHSTDITVLLQSIGQSLIEFSTKSLSQHYLETQIGDHTGCTVLLCGENPKLTDSWQLECWRRQRICELARDDRHLHLSEISSQVSDERLELESRLNAGLTNFLSSLDQSILYELGRPDVFNFSRYNYLAQPDPIIRRNRQQAALTFPLLVGEIFNLPEPAPMTVQMGEVIDSGQKLIDWVTQAFRVRPASAKALRHLSEKMIGTHWRGKLQSLLFLLSTLPPERYPKNSTEWEVFNEAIQFIRATTRHPVCSTSTGILLGEIARRNWVLNKSSSASLMERARCIEAFIGTLGNSLAAYIKVERLGSQGHPVAHAQAVASKALVSLGLRRAELLAVKWQSLSREAEYTYRVRKQGRPFPVLLPDPFFHENLTIVQLTSQADLTRESARLNHCVENYGASCHHGQSAIFSVRDDHGQSRSTFEIVLKPLSPAAYEVELLQHKALHNASPSWDDKMAVSAFFRFLRSPKALPQLMSFSRDKYLAHLEPSLAKDYRYASLMRTFLSESTHARIKFDELVARIVSPPVLASHTEGITNSLENR